MTPHEILAELQAAANGPVSEEWIACPPVRREHVAVLSDVQLAVLMATGGLSENMLMRRTVDGGAVIKYTPPEKS